MFPLGVTSGNFVRISYNHPSNFISMRLSELEDVTQVRQRILQTSSTHPPYSAATERFGWHGYYYRIKKITEEHPQYFQHSEASKAIIEDARALIALMDAEDESVDTLAKVIIKVEAIVEKIRALIKTLHNPRSTNKTLITYLSEVIIEINSVLLLIGNEAVREEEARRLEELLTVVPTIVDAYQTSDIRKPDESIHTRYDQSAENDELILTIAPNNDQPDIARRKILVVGPRSTYPIDNKVIFSSRNFTVDVLKAIFADMRTERELRRKII